MLEGFRVDDALADGRGDLAAGQKGSEEFEDPGDQDGAAYRESARSNGRPHRIGDIVGADRPSHVKAGANRHHKKDGETRVHAIHSSGGVGIALVAERPVKWKRCERPAWISG